MDENLNQSMEVFTKELKDVIDKIKKDGITQTKKENVIDLDFTKDTIYGDQKQIQGFFSDYAKYSSEVEAPKKTKTNPHFKSNYAPLEEVLSTVKPILSKYNISIIQMISSEGGQAGVNTMIAHSNGFLMTFKMVSCKPDKPSSQGYGSVWTYMKRYSLEAVTGVSSEDDDGNDAEPKVPVEKTPLQKVIADITTAVNAKVKINKDEVSAVMKANKVTNHNKITDLALANKVKKEITAIKKVVEEKVVDTKKETKTEVK